MKFILGKKIEMSQMFDEKGNVVPVTLVTAGPCVVLQKKTKEKEGYNSLQIGFEKLVKKSKIKKTMKGKEYRYVREARTDEAGNVGDEINVSATLATAGDVSIYIISWTGQIVKEEILAQLQSGDLQTKLDISSLPSGTYLLRVHLEGKDIINKFVKL